MYLSPLHTNAIREADQVRMELSFGMFEPVNILDICDRLGVAVRFVDFNMEGMFIRGESSTILISYQRPFPRRLFTCAHELGHFRFNHGSKIDPLSSEKQSIQSDKKDELLVDSFAGALLMPIDGIQIEFAKRSINIKKANPIDFFLVASVYGTGYQSLITHSRANGLIDRTKETSLLKFSPARILKGVTGLDLPKSYYRIIDQYTKNATIDLETSNYLILPDNLEIEGDNLEKLTETSVGTLYRACKCGSLQAISSSQNINIRIQKLGFTGLAKYRHLPDYD